MVVAIGGSQYRKCLPQHLIQVSKCTIFIQVSPRFYCKNLRQRLAAKERLGLEYLPKCRDPRCSQDCRNNWACKIAACIARHLRDLKSLPRNLRTYRGNLTLPVDSTVDDHRRVRKEFLRILSRWKAKRGVCLEMHATAHPTNPTNLHYDLVAYSDAPAKPLREALSDAWKRAGGLRYSIVDLADGEVDATARYQTKATPRVDREPRYLLAPRSSCGIEAAWHTAGFWGETSLDAIWKTLVDEWFGEEELTAQEQLEQAQREAERASRAGGVQLLRGNLEPPEPPPYVPGDDVERDRIHFLRRLPRSPGEAIGVDVYSRQWGVSADYMLGILRSCPDAKCLDGWVDPETGHIRFNAWHRE